MSYLFMSKIGLACLHLAEKYEKNYKEVYEVGEGGFGRVCWGYRTDDVFPVSIVN